MPQITAAAEAAGQTLQTPQWAPCSTAQHNSTSHASSCRNTLEVAQPAQAACTALQSLCCDLAVLLVVLWLSSYGIRFSVRSHPRRCSRTARQHPRPEAPTHEGGLSGRSLMKKVLLRRVGVPLPVPSATCASCPLLPVSRVPLSVVSSSAGSGRGINACTCTNTPSWVPFCQAGCRHVCGTPGTQTPAVSRAFELALNLENWHLFRQDEGGLHTALQLWKRSRPLRLEVKSAT